MVETRTGLTARRGMHTNTTGDGYVVWCLSPFIALTMAIRNYKANWAKNVLWLFIIFYGFTFVVSSNQLDANRYILDLKALSEQEATSFAEFFDLLYQEDTNYADIVQPLVTFLVSRVTDDGRILFAVFGLIFGYFYSRNVAFLLSYVNNRIKKEALIFLLVFLFVVSIWQMNGFRFSTATHVFVFGLFNLFSGKRTRGLLFCAGSVLVHFSFILPLSVLLIHLLVGSRLLVPFLLYFASFFITQVSPNLLRNYTTYFPAFLQERSDKYTSDAYLQAREQLSQRKLNWYVDGRIIALTYLTNIILAIVFVKYRGHFLSVPIAANFLSFSLILFGLSNILSEVPSVGVRFQMVSMVPLFASLFLFVQGYRNQLFRLWVKVPFILAALLFIVVEIRIGFDTMGVLTVVGNPFVAPFMDNEVPLIDIIK